jgi:hypothetical protein
MRELRSHLTDCTVRIRQEHQFIRDYERKEVDVGNWFRDLMRIESLIESELSANPFK